MKTLFLDCGMGAAGDMLAAALYELLDDKEAFINQMNAMGLPGVRFVAEPSVKCGITGTHFRVTVDGLEEGHEHHHDHEHEHEHEHELEHHHEHEHEHMHSHAHEHEEHDHDHEHMHSHVHEHEEHDHDHDHEHEHHHDHEHAHTHTHIHRSMEDIRQIINELPLSEQVRNNAMDVYRLIAEAEANAHGRPVTEIHFHEVGTMDAIADVTTVCQLMELLDVERVLASPVHVGFGKVRCAHGILPVPAPATAYILKDVPIYGGKIQGELCTPTGAALLKKFVSSFGEMPPLTIKKIGYGMGTKDFEVANCVRAMLAESVADRNAIAELSCNLDDMTPERIGFAMDCFFAAGALDVYTIPIGMKKSRPGVMLCVICREEDKDRMVRLIFQHTTTLGIRESHTRRYTLQRSVQTVNTPLGEVKVKLSEGYGVTRRKFEYDDLARIARKNNLSIEDVVSKLEQ